MGYRCAQFFREAEKIGGIPAKVRLASLACITSAEAAASNDDLRLVTRLKDALEQVRTEIDTRTGGFLDQATIATGNNAKLVAKLRRHMESFVDIMSQRSLMLGNIREAARRTNEAASYAMDIARVSVWLIDDKRTKITCVDLFDMDKGTHGGGGGELFATQYAPYFAALGYERTIIANDARKDARTACLAKSYLEPLGIGAMLDVPIWAHDRLAGVVCHEHVGGPREWDADEERLGYLLSSFVALALEGSRTSWR
ncbi:GAF domain-containing protein [Pendulispora rubella]|uniref:GAF domain-containing protein n=1 Tax=Pendulispora rubella TaxID=2741070 RepID=A0ABZ2KX31_9BACT